MDWTEKEKQALRDSVESWRGTPHLHRRAIKGNGIDCVYFVAAALVEAGVVEPFTRLPSYPTAWGFMTSENALGDGLSQVLTANRLRPTGFAFGDLVVFKAGRNSNHAGIIVDGRLWHVMTGGTVQPSLIARHIFGIQEIIRIRERGWRIDPSKIRINDLNS